MEKGPDPGYSNDPEGIYKIFVANIPVLASHYREIEQHFSRFGSIEKIISRSTTSCIVMTKHKKVYDRILGCPNHYYQSKQLICEKYLEGSTLARKNRSDLSKKVRLELKTTLNTSQAVRDYLKEKFGPVKYFLLKSGPNDCQPPSKSNLKIPYYFFVIDVIFNHQYSANECRKACTNEQDFIFTVKDSLSNQTKPKQTKTSKQNKPYKSKSQRQQPDITTNSNPKTAQKAIKSRKKSQYPAPPLLTPTGPLEGPPPSNPMPRINPVLSMHPPLTINIIQSPLLPPLPPPPPTQSLIQTDSQQLNTLQPVAGHSLLLKPWPGVGSAPGSPQRTDKDQGEVYPYIDRGRSLQPLNK